MIAGSRGAGTAKGGQTSRVIEATVGELPYGLRLQLITHGSAGELPPDMPVELWFADGPVEEVGAKSSDPDLVAWLRARWHTGRVEERKRT